MKDASVLEHVRAFLRRVRIDRRGLITWQARGGARVIGLLLLILAIVCLGLFVDGTWGVLGILEQWGTGSVTTGVFALVGALIGLAIPTALLILVILV